MRARLVTAMILAAASASLTAHVPSPPPDLKTVLARAAAYVDEFREQLSGIVAEEHYVQQQVPGDRRELRSDLLLVRSETTPRWLQFRDTFEVDSNPVRDRADRLTRLFLQPAATAIEQAQRISAESSRYNLGSVLRTVNVPLMPLMLLERDIQSRFRFSRVADRETRVSPLDETAVGLFRVTTEVWVVRFEEPERPTIVRDPVKRGDVPTQGRFWIEPQSGRVLMSEMRASHPEVRADITVSYQSEPVLGVLVPIAMHESYRRTRPPISMGRIEATATYGKFRRFRVEVDQHVDLPHAPIDKELISEPGTPNQNPEPGTRNPEPNLNTN